MPLCVSCGLELAVSNICIHHTLTMSGYAPDEYKYWARDNRYVCDFIHRNTVHESYKKLYVITPFPHAPSHVKLMEEDEIPSSLVDGSES